jgi:hypothetical protein
MFATRLRKRMLEPSHVFSASRVTEHLVLSSMIDMVSARLKQDARPDSFLFLVEAHSIISACCYHLPPRCSPHHLALSLSSTFPLSTPAVAGSAVSQILQILGVHAGQELEAKLGWLALTKTSRRHRNETMLTVCAGDMLKGASQAAVTSLWATFQQLKFGSSKILPKDGELN